MSDGNCRIGHPDDPGFTAEDYAEIEAIGETDFAGSIGVGADRHAVEGMDIELDRLEGSAVLGRSIRRPQIEVRAGDLHIMATEAEKALITTGAPIYNRGGVVRPIIDDVLAAKGRRTKVARLAEVSADMLVDHLSRCADWFKYDGRRKKSVAADPPRPVAATILARDGEWQFPRLAGVITTPTLRPDGTILCEPGYDAATQLLLLDPPTLPKIPSHPTEDHAKKALADLDSLLDEFPFVDEASRSVALSALITPVVRGAMPVAPLHATSAPVAGSGKSFIIDLAAAISVGQRAPVMAAGRDEAETEKRLVAALLAGQPIISIDNVNGELGGDFLCQMIERPLITPRILGFSRQVRLESRATCFATGNNIRLVGDMTRRVILCSLDPNVERPELRKFDRNPFDEVLADRGKYIAAALTVVRAYVAAGHPNACPPLASFEDWSALVRSALVWLGRADPCATMEAARADDPTTSALSAIMAAWYKAAGSAGLMTGKIAAMANERSPDGNLIHAELREALLEVAEKNPGMIGAKSLGRWLSCHRGRVINGFKFVATDDSHLKQKVWSVVRA